LSSGHLAVVGNGSYGQFLADIALQIGWDKVSIFDDNSGSGCALSDIRLRESDLDGFFLGVGNNAARSKLLARAKDMKLSIELETIVHPAAIINVSISCPGSFIGPGAILNSSEVGECCIINSGAVIEHHAKVSDFAHVSPGSIILGGSKIGSRCWVGAGSIVREEIEIGDDTIVGAGSVVLESFGPNLLICGAPARNIQ